MKNRKVLIIAEAGVNHDGNLEKAINRSTLWLKQVQILLNFKHTNQRS